jgi:hypothetical protein
MHRANFGHIQKDCLAAFHYCRRCWWVADNTQVARHWQLDFHVEAFCSIIVYVFEVSSSTPAHELYSAVSFSMSRVIHGSLGPLNSWLVQPMMHTVFQSRTYGHEVFSAAGPSRFDDG